ncbi:MAG: hypothetical protein AUK35_03610 [Zetaproteobacteria bacterium CG2_30_46_52]|nr:MAG: hypothetical protein AUK35_03610 [Zetaproteobacteria bacterium CG2_30_46_52]
MILFPDQSWAAVVAHIQQAKHIWLTTHRSPDADGIGSQLAMYAILTGMGKRVTMFNRDPAPRICAYLPNADKIQLGEFPPESDMDTVIALDAGSMGRLGFTPDCYTNKTLINIDHHASNPGYGQINIVNAAYCATGAMIYDLAQHLQQTLSKAAAEALYAALLTDTASFHLDRVDAKVFRMAADLVDAGVSASSAAEAIYDTQPVARISLLAAALQTLTLTNEQRVAWLHVDHQHLKTTGGDVEDTEGFIDVVRSIDCVEVVIFVRPESDLRWKVSFRGKHGCDVGKIALALKGGGHTYSAGCAVNGTLQEVYAKIQKVVDASFAS